MRVIQTITGSETVEVSWYSGDSLAQAISAAASAAAQSEEVDRFFTVTSVRIEF
jgi:hypothetical protein